MYPVFLALRYARSRAVTYLALLTVALSVASFVVIMSVLGGFRHEVEKIIQETGAPLEIYCSAASGIPDAGKLATKVSGIPRVRGASPYLESMSLIRTSRFRTLGVVRGVDLGQELRHGGLGEYLHGALPVENIGPLSGQAAGTGRRRVPGPRSFVVPEHLRKQEIDKGSLEPWEDPDSPGTPGSVPVWPQDERPKGREVPRSDDDEEGLIPRKPVKPEPGEDDLPRGVIVGANRADRLGLDLGDQMIMAVQDPYREDRARVRKFYVIGYYKSDTDWLNDIILIDLGAARDLAGQDEATGVSIWLQDSREIFTMRERVRKVFPEDPWTRVRTWRESRPEIFGMMDMQDRVMMIILLVFFVMTGAFIMAILVVLVTEKTRDIGTIRALGAGRMGVVMTFVSQGLAIGVFGVAMGLGGGWLLSKNVNPVVDFLDAAMAKMGAGQVFGSISRGLFVMDELPVHYDPVHFIAMVVTTVAVSFLASLVPAWMAARMDPVEALRHE
ncbi:MAG: ABC transporter permease [Planctomycetota bacterium]